VPAQILVVLRTENVGQILAFERADRLAQRPRKHVQMTVNQGCETKTSTNEVIPIFDNCRVIEVDIDRIAIEIGGDRYTAQALKKLMASIKACGQISPVIVRQTNPDPREESSNHYELLSGRRRLWARKHLGDRFLSAIVLQDGDDQYDTASFQLPDNLHRDAPDPFDVAAWLKERKDKNQLTDEDLANEIGRSRSNVTQFLSINNLSVYVRDLARKKAKRLTYGFLIELAQLGGNNEARLVLEAFADGTATRSLVRNGKELPIGCQQAAKASAAARRMVKHLELATAVGDATAEMYAELREQLRLAVTALSNVGVDVLAPMPMFPSGHSGSNLGVGAVS
jgi:ParB/RepB/Spo0J family partition protein